MLFVSWRTTAEQLCVRRPCAAASVRALSVAAVMSAAQARALLQPLPSTTSIPCHALYAGVEERSGEVRNSVGSAVFSIENACSSVQSVIFFYGSRLSALVVLFKC